MKKKPLLPALLLSFLFIATLSGAPSAVNLLPGDSSYEGGMGYFRDCWFGTGGPAVVEDCPDAPDGLRCVVAELAPGGSQSNNGDPIPLKAGRRYVLSLWSRGDTPATGTVAVVNRHWKDTQTFDYGLSSEWKRFEIAFTPKFDEEYWLVLGFRNPSETSPVHVAYDAVQLEEGEQATPFQPQRIFSAGISISSTTTKVFFPEETPVLRMNAADMRGDTPGAVTWTISVTDYKGDVIERRDGDVEWSGRSFGMRLPLPSGTPGLFTVRGSWRDAVSGEVLFEDILSYAVVQHPKADDPEVVPYLGVSSSVKPGLERVGVRWIEIGMWWRSFMPTDSIEKAHYDEFLARFAQAKKSGFKVKFSLVHLPSAPAWAMRPEEVAEARSWGLPCDTQGFFGTKEALAKLGTAFEELIRRAGDDIDLLEIGGEDELISGSEPYYRRKYPDAVVHGFVHGPVCDDLAEITTTYLQASRRGNPALEIAAGRPSGGSENYSDFEFSRQVLEQVEGKFEYFPMDCYSFKMRYLSPENMPNIGSPNKEYPGVFERANRMTRTYLDGQRPFVSEYGFAIDNRLAPDHPLQQEETRRMQAAALTAKLLGSPFFFWFNTSGCIESNVFDYGMWHGDEPMLLIPAMSQIAKVVEGVRECDGRLGVPESNLKMGVFGQKDRAYLALWTEQGENPVRIPLPEGAYFEDFLGIRQELPVDGLFAAKPLTQFIVLDGVDAYERLRGAMKEAEDCAISLVWRLHVKDASEMQIEFDDLVLESTDGVLCEYSFNGAGRMVVKKEAGTRFPWIATVEPPAGAEYLDMKVTDGAGRSREARLEFPSTRLKMGRNVVSTFGNERQDIFPADPWIRWDGAADLGGEIHIDVDEKNITLSAMVTDDLHFNTRDNEAIWNGDCFQFGISPRVDIESDFVQKGYGPGDIEIAMALTKEGPVAYCHYGWKTGPVDGLDYHVERDDGACVTTYRIVIPREKLGLEKPGAFLRMACVVLDDDDGSGQSYLFQSSPGITGTKNIDLFQIYRLP